MNEINSASSTGAIAILTAVATFLPGLATAAALSEVDVGSAPPKTGFLQARQIVGASRIATTLGSTPSIKKTYRLTCFDDGSGAPINMRLRVQNRTKASTWRVQAILTKNGETQSIVDSKNGDNVFSNYLTVSQGPGDYILTITKVKAKPKDSSSKLKGAAVVQTMQECDTQTGKYTGISPPVSLD